MSKIGKPNPSKIDLAIDSVDFNWIEEKKNCIIVSETIENSILFLKIYAVWMHVMQPHDGSLCTHYNTNDDNKHTCAPWKNEGKWPIEKKERERTKNTVKMSAIFSWIMICVHLQCEWKVQYLLNKWVPIAFDCVVLYHITHTHTNTYFSTGFSVILLIENANACCIDAGKWN